MPSTILISHSQSGYYYHVSLLDSTYTEPVKWKTEFKARDPQQDYRQWPAFDRSSGISQVRLWWIHTKRARLLRTGYVLVLVEMFLRYSCVLWWTWVLVEPGSLSPAMSDLEGTDLSESSPVLLDFQGRFVGIWRCWNMMLDVYFWGTGTTSQLKGATAPMTADRSW